MAQSLAVIGAGAWGTALAASAAKNGETLIWALEPETVSAINETHENPVFLPDCVLPETLRATSSLEEVADCAMLLWVVPAQFSRNVAEQMRPFLEKSTSGQSACLISCAKGLEARSGAMMSEVFEEVLPAHDVMVLSGPSFAAEVAKGLPVSLLLAARDEKRAGEVKARLENPTFRIYLSRDIKGAQLGGAVKNVLAIACGMVKGRNLGENAHAALLTHGLGELMQLGQAAGADAETLTGLAGLGDIILTCSSSASRNFSFGEALASGQSAAEILGKRRTVSEGAAGVQALLALAQRLGVAMPIAQSVAQVMAGEISVDEAITALFAPPAA